MTDLSQEIVVFGAGGRAGRAIVGQALRRGHSVVGVVRDPVRHEDLAGPGLRLVAGDITDPACAPVFAGNAAALVNAVTPFSAPPESFDNFDGSYYVRIVQNLARAANHMREARVIEIGLAATLKAYAGRLYEDAQSFPPFLVPFAEARMRGVEAWSDHPGDTDWLILTPPPLLSPDAPSTGRYRLGDDVLDPAAAGAALSYIDLAMAVLDEIESPTRHREQATVYGVE